MATAKSKQVLKAGRRIRVLIVDDSSVMRRLVTLALETDPCFEIVGSAQNGREAVEQVTKLTPDVVTLDIEMPEMDGLEALRHIRQLAPAVRVVMLSTLTSRGASATLEALSLGADDYLTKAVNGKSVYDSTSALRTELAPKIKQFFAFASTTAQPVITSPSKQEPAALRADPTLDSVHNAGESPCQVVTIGISTGGPAALASIIPSFPANFKLPILIVQHMPPLFTKLLCERLQERSQLCVREGVHGEIVKPGIILVAPGDFHMKVYLEKGEKQARILLDQGPAENSCRPAVDVLFESIADVYGGAVVAAVLTGMGHDGLRGAKLLKRKGARIIAQDEASSAVWGMPRAIVNANIADAVLPLDRVVPEILRLATRTKAPQQFSLQEMC